MTQLFLGQKALRFRYYELVAGPAATDVPAGSSVSFPSTAVSIATAVPLFRTNKELKICLLNNGMNVDVGFGVVFPGADLQDVTNRLFFFDIGASSVLNFDISGSLGLSIDAGTTVVVWNRGGGTPSPNTKIRIIAWG